MSDDTSKTGPADRSRVSLGQEHEVDYWTERFHVTRERLQNAVAAVGSSVNAVEGWLANN